jgi:hypothetical protein
MERTGSKVTIRKDQKKGMLTIEFYTDEELERLYEHLLML